MFGNADKIKLYSLLTQMTDLNRQMGDWWSSLRELRDKVDKLYKPDKHGTFRPKVDILDDEVFRDMGSLEMNVDELQEKVEKLEKVK